MKTTIEMLIVIDKGIMDIENMGDDEENIPDLVGISRSLQEQ